MNRFVPLSLERFSEQRWSRFTDYRHAAQLHLIALAAPEISKAAAHLPLAFACSAQDTISLCMLTGLNPGINHCLDDRNQWQAGYVPAFVRSYPFRLLTPPPGKGQPNQRVVCVDNDSPWVGEHAELAFFADGQPTPAVQEVIDFLGQIGKHYVMTERAVDGLNQAGLLTPWKLSSPQGEQIKGLLRLNEAKMSKINRDSLFKLHQQGSLAVGYAQALSTQQLPRLQALAQAHDQRQPAINLDQLFDSDSDSLFKFD